MQKKNNIAEITRIDFPLISNNKNLIYLDHAATSQKPYKVIDALKYYYEFDNANVHRGAHQLSCRATKAFENARDITAGFINAESSREIVFTRNATEAINLVAYSWGDSNLKEGDEILISLMEHHSNIVPWQLLAKRKKCIIKYIGITHNGELDIDDAFSKINEKTRICSIQHVSNVLGCCNPINKIAEKVHNFGALIMIDACQSLAHQPINVRDLKIDFLAGSAHKLCGPTGSGFLWAKEKTLENMPPFLGGGEMIQDVSLDSATWADLPHKFEAGTPAIAEAIGMGAALKYLQSIGLHNIKSYERELTEYLFKKLELIEDIYIMGPRPDKDINRAPLATFTIKNIHSNDIASLLDANNICIRSGHHCCQPLHKFFGINSSARASLNFTSTINEIDLFVEQLISVINLLKDNS
ncbi:MULTISPECIES: SufS family cysteine desulfurase [Prochlorococcus]|uniref:SufS family cysteine desulfurase n=1 Tax=Prochlorococcus TaxID=1218 RepID=UPI000533B0AD|nr:MULTISPECIES: SufS family cysteine desulfurase [Prochlorococcus]KGG13312.1 Cysteine desulfurase [Prochlorococcus sp. MIT 0601]